MKVVAPVFELNWNLLFSAITFLVLFLVMKHFLFDKVHDFMEARSQEVQDQLDHADEMSRQADEKMADYTERIAGAEDEGREIIRKARADADEQAKEILREADEESQRLLEHSRKEIQRERYDAEKQLRDQIGSLAAMAAGKILEREISAEDHRDIVDKIIEEAEETPWS